MKPYRRESSTNYCSTNVADIFYHIFGGSNSKEENNLPKYNILLT